MKLVPRAMALALAATAALPAAAQSEAELRQALEAQKAINEQLRRRVQELERAAAGTPVLPALRPADAPAPEPESAQAASALEEALVGKGLVLLPPGAFRLSPELSWSHSGSDALRSRSDTVTGAVTLQAGLPLGMMVGATLPYVHRDTALGTASGVGDWSVELAKKLNNETERLPSFVAGLRYSHNSGRDAFSPVPVGSGFRGVGLSLSALKRIEPVAVYGGVAWSHAFSRRVTAASLLGETPFAGRLSPGDAWSYRLGVSLAATPDINLDASVSGAFIRPTRVQSDALGASTLPKATVAFVNLGAGFILARNLSLSVGASAGATSDSPDFILSTVLSYRF